MTTPSAQPLIGRRIGPYAVTSLLGIGGMGEVYRATDERLGREVAIKVLPALFSRDHDRLRRFEQEARTAGLLNHPNIVTVHDVGVVEDMPYIVSEMLDGETLRERLSHGAPTPQQSVDYALQIAQGLAAVHEKGIVHRDLKPENLFLTRDGRIKILDFGLAKLVPGGLLSSASNAPTILTETEQGVILGTVGYMSPEQVLGRDADHRSDIFSFGAIFYEMLAGRRAFGGDSKVEVLNAILKQEPPTFAERERPCSPGLERVLRRSLEKDPRTRFQSANDLAFAIDALAQTSGDVPGTLSPSTRARAVRRRSTRFAWIAAGLLVIALAGLLAVPHLHPATAPPVMRLEVITPPGPGPASVALSPDSRRLVFVSSANGVAQLWVRILDSEKSMPIEGTENAKYPFWSPDGTKVGFFADNQLKRIDISGGRPQRLWDAPDGNGGAWGPGDIILFSPSPNSPLLQIQAAGGDASPATKLGEQQTSHRFPVFLPDGRRFLYAAAGAPSVKGIFMASLDAPDIKRVAAIDSRFAYLASGWLMFIRESTLLAQRFDAARGELSVGPVKVADLDRGRSGEFSVSATGTVAYASNRPDRRQLMWFDRSGRSLGTVGDPDENGLVSPELSPDGRVAFHRSTTNDIWILDEGRPSRFTFDERANIYPVWSPRGDFIAFASRLGTSYEIRRKQSSPSGVEKKLLESRDAISVPDDWSPDGRFILYFHQDRKTGNIDDWVLPLEGDGKPWAFLDSKYEERHGQFRPDGKWVAYTSNQTGHYEVHVASFPTKNQQYVISTSGGIQPRWSADGNELYYLAPDGMLMAVRITTKGTTLERGTPSALFQTHVWGGGVNVASRRQYAVAKNGQFLINVATQDTGSPITILLNWKPPEK